MATAPPIAPKGTARRDRLLSLEVAAQAKWELTKPFEVDAPESDWDGGKFFTTFPYPYMNGKLHLGHAFSLTKAEFACAYYRMRGRKALFPFAFHCTGMPIQAAAFKLKKEYELYGSPLPNFPPSPPEVVGEMDAANGCVTIGWKIPTCTGGKTLTGFAVLVRAGGANGEWVEKSTLSVGDAAADGQCSHTVTGLTEGETYAFKVRSLLEGADGVDSKPLAKTADGKKELKLQAKKEASKKDDKGGKPAKGKPAKVVAKTGGLMTQWDILRSMGLSPEECLPFVDPVYWLEYFPPRGKTDLIRFGLGVDWRRSFITTDYNPYYDSFVRWQFNKLREGDFIAFGKRPSIFSEADGQPCMDHDRDKGEGVAPQEYTALKMRLLEPFPDAVCTFEGKSVYLLAGTLRAETMCGQTNAWILPEGEYGAYEATGGEIWICGERAARNMSFQDLFPEWGKPKELLKVWGRELLGAAVSSPQSPYEKIYMLPLTTISMSKGTAIVTSVPSDSPDDYAAFMDLKNAKKREFYGVKAEWIEPFELVPILETPDLGTLSAKYMCEKLKVQSQKDVDKLKEAHDVCYNSGFYKGVMTAGAFVGMKVEDAKLANRKKLVDDKQAIVYLEPEGLVTPRSTPERECVVALVDQWYLKYGADSWAAEVGKHLESHFECYNPAVKKAFSDALGWLSEWACSRSFGLGTRMPWDEQFLIESLSDSTIYMAYYTVAHLLQGGQMFGKSCGPANVTPEQCDGNFWDHVLLGCEYTGSVPSDVMSTLRREFSFWYPMDMRVSGKDLIPNHLTMSLYNHAAVWKDSPEMWPRSCFCNGFVQVDAEKMSKSKGNFITLEGAMGTWGADATRFTCADAGDGILNANYDRVVADRAILNLTTELDWITQTLAGTQKETSLRAPTAADVWLDGWFENEMSRLVRQASASYEAMRFREAIKFAYFGMQEARDRYRSGTAQVGIKENLLRQWAEYQALVMVPITPHWSEALWEVLGHEGCAVSARWPTPPKAEDAMISAAGGYLFDVSHQLAAQLAKRDKQKTKGEPQPKPNQVNIYVASTFPKWKEVVLQILRDHYDPQAQLVADEVMRVIKSSEELAAFNKGKQVAQFAAAVREEAKTKGAQAFALTMPFDEASTLTQNVDYLKFILGALHGIRAVHVITEGGQLDEASVELMSSAAPGKPAISFFYDEEIKPPHPAAETATAAAETAAAAAETAAAAAAPAASPASAALSMMAYLEKHKVTQTLNEMVNKLATEQPEEPYAWLAKHLGLRS